MGWNGESCALRNGVRATVVRTVGLARVVRLGLAIAWWGHLSRQAVVLDIGGLLDRRHGAHGVGLRIDFAAVGFIAGTASQRQDRGERQAANDTRQLTPAQDAATQRRHHT